MATAQPLYLKTIIAIVLVASSWRIWTLEKVLLASFPATWSDQNLRELGFRVFGAAVVYTTVSLAVLEPKGIMIVTKYLPGSKLKSMTVNLKGFARLAPFTLWSWCCIGIYFTVSAVLSYIALMEGTIVSAMWRRVAAVLFEVAFSTSILVTVVTTFALVPYNRSHKPPPNPVLGQWKALVFHNANVTLMVVEMLLRADDSVLFLTSDVAFAFALGAVYSIHAWSLFNRGGYYFYFFLDHTLSATKVKAVESS